MPADLLARQARADLAGVEGGQDGLRRGELGVDLGGGMATSSARRLVAAEEVAPVLGLAGSDGRMLLRVCLPALPLAVGGRRRRGSRALLAAGEDLVCALLSRLPLDRLGQLAEGALEVVLLRCGVEEPEAGVFSLACGDLAGLSQAV